MQNITSQRGIHIHEEKNFYFKENRELKERRITTKSNRFSSGALIQFTHAQE